MISRTQLSLLAIAIGVGVLLSQWSVVARPLARAVTENRPQHLSVWQSTGTPEEDKQRAEQFMVDHPEIHLDFNATSSGPLTTILNISFLSGSPPDVLSVPTTKLRDYVVKGMLRPLDDLVAAEVARNPNFYASLAGGEQALVRFRAQPGDFYLRNADRFPLQAARLINMDGRIIGMSSQGAAPGTVLTYNQRLFRETAARIAAYRAAPDDPALATLRRASELLADGVLVDVSGEAVPPRTWSDLLRTAEVISAYGETFADESDRPCGLVIQGQFADRDLFKRTIIPLAMVAGSQGFDFRSGRFVFDDPAFLGAARFVAVLERRGAVLSGTKSRDYEKAREEVGRGRAAMIIDGPHVPGVISRKIVGAKAELRVAPLPVPDAAIVKLLGVPLGQGVVDGRNFGGKLSCISAACPSASAAWIWLNQTDEAKEINNVLKNYVLPSHPHVLVRLFEDQSANAAAFRREKVEPFVVQLYAAGLSAQPWPTAPALPPVEAKHVAEAMNQAFSAAAKCTDAEFEELLTRVAAAAGTWNAELNKELQKRIARFEEHPGEWTLPEFDPRAPASAAATQRIARAANDFTALRARLPADVREEISGFRPPWLGWTLLMIGGLIGVAVVAFLIGAGWNDRKAGRPALRATFTGMRRSWHAYVLILPAMLALFTFVLYPALFQGWLSLHRGDGIDITGMIPVGADNYLNIAKDRTFYGEVLPRTFLYMTVVAVVEIAIALFLAILLALPLRGMYGYRTMFFVPMVTSAAAVSTILLGVLADTGSINQMLAGIGIIPDAKSGPSWLGPDLALWSVMGFAIWAGLPHNTILCLAGLQSIDPALYEAAKVDGANAWQRFWHITLPQLRPIILIMLFNALVGAARHFGTVFTLTEGKNNTQIVSTYIFHWGMGSDAPNVGYASALGIAYALVLAALTFVNVWYVAKRWRARMAAEEGR